MRGALPRSVVFWVRRGSIQKVFLGAIRLYPGFQLSCSLGDHFVLLPLPRVHRGLDVPHHVVKGLAHHQILCSCIHDALSSFAAQISVRITQEQAEQGALSTLPCFEHATGASSA